MTERACETPFFMIWISYILLNNICTINGLYVVIFEFSRTILLSHALFNFDGRLERLAGQQDQLFS